MCRRGWLKTVALLAVGWACLPASAGAAAKPNFVVVFTDDQGYGDLSCFGGEHVSTPRIDQMAAEGSRLTSFYVAAPVCTPSRAALMTGCYPRQSRSAGVAAGQGVAAMIGTTGPKEITRSIMYSKDGLHFSKTHTVIDVPHAAGAYRPEAFTDSVAGKRIQWGVHIGKQKGSLPFIQRFDLVEAE